MSFLIFCIVVAIIVAIVLTTLYVNPLIEVVGDSMYPTYRNGEFLQSRRISKSEKLTEGKVYVYKSPTNDVVIKRLLYDTPHGLFFVGDNVQCSFDSRSYGCIPRENVIAEIINP